MFRRVLIASLLTSLSVVGCAKTHSMSAASRIAGAREMEDQFLAAFNRGDVDAVAAGYLDSNDTVMYAPDVEEVRGTAAIHGMFADMVKNAPGCKLELTERHERASGEDVITWGKWKMTIPNGTKVPIVATGRFTDVKTLVDGKWKYVVDHASVSPPARK